MKPEKISQELDAKIDELRKQGADVDLLSRLLITSGIKGMLEEGASIDDVEKHFELALSLMANNLRGR